ncbi:MAG: ABC transporter ATP-binding protein [Planctomycetota bacterium]|nr:MAG: ABC transporter ATP-binding protein [Planctomycetota bacterium]
MLLEVTDLAYAYGSLQAVAGASFHIESGEIFGFLGPNGAGKTTTISCLCGLLTPQSGSITLDGQAFMPWSKTAHRAHLGVVPQELAVYGELSGRENLQFIGQLQGLQGKALEQAVERALEFSGLQDRAKDRVKQYSGGMKRRLNLAMGDLHQPRLLLLDEPTVGVDPQSRNHLFESLRFLRQEGRTLLYTTHYMEEAQRLCDRVAILNEGKIVAVGNAETLAEQAGIPGANLEEVFLKLTGRSLRD